MDDERRSFEPWEFELIYLTRQSASSTRALSELLGRPPGSVGWMHRYCDEQADIGGRSSEAALTCAAHAKDTLGHQNRGVVSQLIVAFMPRDVRLDAADVARLRDQVLALDARRRVDLRFVVSQLDEDERPTFRLSNA